MQEFFSIFQDSLGKQCWVVLGRVLSTVRSDPAQLVTALRIVERETRYHLLCIIFYFFGINLFILKSHLLTFLLTKFSELANIWKVFHLSYPSTVFS